MSEQVEYKEQNTNSNPLKAIDILEGLAQNPSGLVLHELAAITKLNKSTVYRITNSLIERHYVIRDETTKKYRLTFKILGIGSSILDTIEIAKMAKPYLRKLADISQETVHLICRDGYEAIYLDKIDTPNTIGLKSQIGKRIPLYCTGGGKTLLAYSEAEFKISFFEKTKLEAFTSNTITSKDKLLLELEQIKENGFALDDQEHHDNITCIAVPILNKQGKIEASISIAAPTYRFSTDLAKTFIPSMKKNAELIAQNLPY